MRLDVLLNVLVLSAAPLLSQEFSTQFPQEFRTAAIGGVSIGADYAGREALCEQLRLMSTRPKDVPILPEGAELLCVGDGSPTFVLRLKAAPASADKFLCEFATQPSSLVFYQIRPIALKSGSTVTPPDDLSGKLQPLGVRTLGDLLGAFGFIDLELRRSAAKESFRQIGVHELHLLCHG